MHRAEQNHVVSTNWELPLVGGDIHSMRSYIRKNIMGCFSASNNADLLIFRCAGEPVLSPDELLTEGLDLTIRDSRKALTETSVIHTHNLAFLYVPTVCPGFHVQSNRIIPSIIFNRGLTKNHFRSSTLPLELSGIKNPLTNANGSHEITSKIWGIHESLRLVCSSNESADSIFKQWLAKQYQILLDQGAAMLTPEEPGYFAIIPNGIPHALHVPLEYPDESDGGVIYSEFTHQMVNNGVIPHSSHYDA